MLRNIAFWFLALLGVSMMLMGLLLTEGALRRAWGETVTIQNPRALHTAPACLWGRAYRTPWGESVFSRTPAQPIYRLCVQGEGASGDYDRDAVLTLPEVTNANAR